MSKKFSSPNYGEREGVELPSLIILHYTGMESAKAALARLCDPASGVSAHYVVEEDGAVHHLVPGGKRAWHAGRAYWDGMEDVNSHSLGIELVNPGHEFGYRPFPDAQMRALIELCRKLMKDFDIKEVLAHSDVAPERKEDPGELFGWRALAGEGIGLWPEPEAMDAEEAAGLAGNEAILHELLVRYGYNPAAAFPVLARAFNRRFRPEAFQGGDPSRLDETAVARLLALVRLRHAGKT